MKNGSTHLAHKAEHAVDMDSGAVIAVTLQSADLGDTTTVHETLADAGMAVADLVERDAELHPEDEPKVNVDGIEELVADKGYHSGAVVAWVGENEVVTYIPERKQAGKRNWDGKQAEQQAVEANHGRVTGDYGKQLLGRRENSSNAALPTVTRRVSWTIDSNNHFFQQGAQEFLAIAIRSGGATQICADRRQERGVCSYPPG